MTLTGRTLTITQGIGYTGATGGKAWAARLTGTCADFGGLQREFLDADRVTRDHFGRAKYTRTYAYDLADGLYEISEHGDRYVRLVWTAKGETKSFRPRDERIAEILALMDEGQSFDAARRATAPPAKTETQTVTA